MKNSFSISGQIVLIDPEDALEFVGMTLFVGSNGYVRVSSKGTVGERYIHRIITGVDESSVVDHINGNKLDNRRVNLRVCSHQQNMCNAKLNNRNKTGVTGVRWDASRMRWAAQISANNKTIPLGRFDDFEAAVNARKKAELIYHGEFAGSLGAQS